ncbi:hypothetical protein [Aquimarina rhabdastrellae]
MNKTFMIGLVCLFFTLPTKFYAQQSIKRDKQKTKFHYLQTNFHIGYFNEGDENYFDLSNVGPSNNITYRFLSKNQRQLQKGYTTFMAINNFAARVSLQFNGGFSDKNTRADVYSLRLQNLGLNFKTKWDRTKLFVGYNSVRFGLNPKIDPVSNFTANVTKQDIGFNQDAGVFFRSPISKNFDAEIGATIGGTISKPLAWFSNDLGDEWNVIEPEYRGTWLVTGRIGTPNFKSFEYGLIAMSGRLEDTENDTRQINRIGFDLMKKISESWKIGGQAAIGNTVVDHRSDETNYNFQGNIEYYFKGRFIFNISNGVLIANPKDSGLANTLNGQWINSFSYVLSPHTRLRLNHFVNYQKDANADWGVTFQLITGFGKR